MKKNQYMIMLDLDKKELKNMPKDKIVDKYITNVTIVNDDPEFQKYMSEEEDKKKIQNSLLSEAKEEGISKGVSQEKVNIAKNMLNKNMSIEDISEITGQSINEIKGLKLECILYVFLFFEQNIIGDKYEYFNNRFCIWTWI